MTNTLDKSKAAFAIRLYPLLRRLIKAVELLRDFAKHETVWIDWGDPSPDSKDEPQNDGTIDAALEPLRIECFLRRDADIENVRLSKFLDPELIDTFYWLVSDYHENNNGELSFARLESEFGQLFEILIIHRNFLLNDALGPWAAQLLELITKHGIADCHDDSRAVEFVLEHLGIVPTPKEMREAASRIEWPTFESRKRRPTEKWWFDEPPTDNSNFAKHQPLEGQQKELLQRLAKRRETVVNQNGRQYHVMKVTGQCYRLWFRDGTEAQRMSDDVANDGLKLDYTD